MGAIEKDIIIIKGAPASGKSQAAKELAKYFPKGVRIEVDNLRSMVISVDWINQEEHINILNLSSKLSYEFYNLGFEPIIIVDTFSGDKLDSYYKKLRTLNDTWSISLFGLFSDEATLKKRLESRSNDKFKDFKIAKKINEDVLNSKHEKEFQIDTSNLESKETAKIIYDNLLTINTSP